MQSFLDQFKALRRQGRPVALATVVGINDGSSKRVGAQMWVDSKGGTYGSLTVGGCVDGRARKEAICTLDDHRARRFNVDLGEDGLDFGMSCAGSVDIYVQEIDLSDDEQPAVRALETVHAEVARGRRAIFAMPLDDDAEACAMTAETHEHALLQAQEAGWDYVPGRGGLPDMFYQSFVPPRRLIVVGAAPIADPLVRLGKMMDFHVMIIDGKDERLEDRFPEADERRSGMPSEIVRALKLDARTAVVLTAHDYRYEVPVLRELLQHPVAYIGMVASRQRGSAVLDFLAQSGVENTDRVRTPAGLDIGAETPAEIAVSIMTEIVAEREEATGLSLSVFRPAYAKPSLALAATSNRQT